jgi:hypothetical protein
MGSSIGRGTRGTGSCVRWLGVALFAAGASPLVPAAAHAQPPARAAAPSGPVLIHPDPAADAIALGRIRMAKGDCAGALEAFDAALRTSVDVTVRRDRGLCHEQLGQPFPAMDDFRAYLTVVPDAADAEDIRMRLNQLEVANGLGGTGTGGTSAVGGSQANGTSKVTADHEDPFAVDARDPGAKAPGSSGAGDSANGSRAGNYDEELAQNDRWDEAEASPMRRGTGLSFGAYGRGYGGTSNGVSGYGVGATIRGALGRVSTLYGEIGYATYQAGNDDVTGERLGGLTIGLGYEARIRLDEFASNAIILAGVVSYERVMDANTHALVNDLNPRAKLGYRHVFGPGFGVEIGAELAQPIDLSSGSAPTTFFGGTLALLVGF